MRSQFVPACEATTCLRSVYVPSPSTSREGVVRELLARLQLQHLCTMCTYLLLVLPMSTPPPVPLLLLHFTTTVHTDACMAHARFGGMWGS